MATNNQIVVSELDFDRIKANIKTFLKGQSELSDYDFEGSGLSLLLDILAYNTHYNALYTNLAVNESWLDSAVKRSSVVSRAHAIGYVPRSARAATAELEVIVPAGPNDPPTMYLSQDVQFSSTVNGRAYTFYPVESYTAVKIGNNYTFPRVIVKEGTYIGQSYTITDISKKVFISNPNCDTTTLVVAVRDTMSSTTTTTYRLATDILNVKSTDTVYFLKEIDNGKYELEFGNDVVGKSLVPGNVVTISYIVTNKAEANDARIFIPMNLGFTVNTLAKSYGGAEPESIDSIKYLAPKMFNAVNRAVTVDDYKTIIQKLYPNIDAINVWSGADNFPPVYGKVFISIKPSNETVLSPAVKTLIKNEILKSKNIVTITPEFVDPFYLNIQLSTTIYYDKNTTTKTGKDIEALVRYAIALYNQNELKRFDSVFRFSKLSAIIDNADPSIKSNISTITIRRPVIVKYNTAAKYTFHIDNPIYSAGVPEEALTSTGFYVSGSTEIQYLIDDGFGIIKRYYLDSENNKVYTNNNQGSIVYSNGEITLNDLTIVGLASSSLDLIIKPQSNDVISVREHIVQLDFNYFTINSIEDTISMGNSYGGTNYIFTPSR